MKAIKNFKKYIDTPKYKVCLLWTFKYFLPASNLILNHPKENKECVPYSSKCQKMLNKLGWKY